MNKIIIIIQLYINVANLGFINTYFLIFLMFLRIYNKILIITVYLYAFLNASRFFCQRRRISTSISTRRFPPLTISSPFFVIVYISTIIILILILGVGCELEVISRGVRVGVRVSSISLRFPPRSFLFVAVIIIIIIIIIYSYCIELTIAIAEASTILQYSFGQN